MPRPVKPELVVSVSKASQYKVGDLVRVSMPNRQIEEGVVKAIYNTVDGLKLQVAFGKSRAELVPEWRVIKEEGH